MGSWKSLSKMGSTQENRNIKKAKLPRKRKKRAIKVQGRKWYLDTIKLHKLTIYDPQNKFFEPICKFWVNNSVTLLPQIVSGGRLIMSPTPTQYW